MKYNLYDSIRISGKCLSLTDTSVSQGDHINIIDNYDKSE